MDSFFFNTMDSKYKVKKLYEKGTDFITRTDISNGLVFFDISLDNNVNQSFPIKNLDRMIVLALTKDGSFSINDNITKKEFLTKEDNVDIYYSSKQDFDLIVHENKKSNMFILFIADFFLKRYLTNNTTEPIDFLYNKIQGDISLERINSQPIDALSIYLINKIINTQTFHNMNSIRYEHNVMEFMIHRFSLIDFYDESINEDELYIAKMAKKYLLKNFIDAPTIQELAHLCATNESKLKKIFKKVYKITIYGYIQKLKLEKANVLLKEQVLNIGEIAKEIGYKHQGHFSKLFFDNFGVHPKDLLKK